MTYGKRGGLVTTGIRPLLAKTCADCGKLKPGRSFSRSQNGYAVRCGTCNDRKKKGITPDRFRAGVPKKEKVKPVKVVRKTTEPFTERDLIEMKLAIGRSATDKELAKLTGRPLETVQATVQRYQLRR